MEPYTTPKAVMQLSVLLEQTLQKHFRFRIGSRNGKNRFTDDGRDARLDGSCVRGHTASEEAEWVRETAHGVSVAIRAILHYSFCGESEDKECDQSTVSFTSS